MYRLRAFAALFVSLAAAVWPMAAQSSGTPAENALKFQAFWIDRTTVMIPAAQARPDGVYKLLSDPDAHIGFSSTGMAAHYTLTLRSGAPITPEQAARFPQLAQNYAALHFAAGVSPAIQTLLLKGQLALSIQKADGTLTYATGIQTAGVLDDLFAYDGKLGVVLGSAASQDADWQRFGGGAATGAQIRVWAPTAQAISLQLFQAAAQMAPAETVAMHEHNGVWTATVDAKWIGLYYLFAERVYAPSKRAIGEHTVTDPYSTDLSLNGSKSRVLNPDDPATQPAGWLADRAPQLDRTNDLSFYELHIRDFSVADETVPAAHRGMYLAFTEENSDGMKHLEALAAAGMRAVHLLPTFHFSGVDEDKSTWKTTPDLRPFPADGKQQQAAVNVIKQVDAYNWGYGPLHYMTPEGSYAENPDQRVKEYRQMVMALHHAGLRVVQDVVFNHTSGFGEDAESVLDKVVPNYYNRLDADGKLFTATCCADTATEHHMMGKLQQDTLLWEAKQYHADGFRFDLMGFTFVDNLKKMRLALDKLSMANDGVDGTKVYLYGEGWEFGEMQHDALGIAATQKNLYGLGVGSFNDRMRDSIRGGGVSGDQQPQGFATGLFTDPGHSPGSRAEQRKTLLHEEDLIKLSLAGNLRGYRFADSSGGMVTGDTLLYNGHPAGYTASPQESINYDAAHDDMDLFDAVQVKSAGGDDLATRIRRHVLAMSLIAFGQGMPFYMGGEDMLRSKDMDNNSYNSGDWFNKIDWSGRDNNWGIGLPMVDDDGSAWAVERPLLAKPSLKPSADQIRQTSLIFQELLKIRYSSPLFRMGTLEEVQKHLHFLPVETPGVIAMELDGEAGSAANLLVVFNGTPAPQPIQAHDAAMVLHPVQRQSVDATVRTSTYAAGSATIPALTTAVFVSAP